jgi:hypothetical protein
VGSPRLSVGEIVAAAAGVALFVVMFLPWYGSKATSGGVSASGPNASAWEAFDFIDLVLLLTAVLAVGVAVARAAQALPETLPVPPAVLVHVSGALAVVLIVYRLIDTPGATGSFGNVDVDVTRKIGIFLGLIAAAGISIGGRATLSAQRRESSHGDGPRG